MKKVPLYSRSMRAASAATESAAGAPAAGASSAEAVAALPGSGAADARSDARRAAPAMGTGAASALPVHAVRPPSRWTALRRHERTGWLLFSLGVALLAGWPAWRQREAPPALSVQQIDKAMRASLTEQPLRSATAVAAEKIAPSVVRIVGYHDEASMSPAARRNARLSDKAVPKPPVTVRPDGNRRDDEDDDDQEDRAVGTGVVIVDNGTILTNLHVVQGAKRIEVTFADGHRSPAKVVVVRPEHDLAVIRATSIPDDLQPATMRSTADLNPGDAVVAVGYPFGIGPSTSAGIVSGLKRDFRSPEGKGVLSNLIQFDAAANPGNSGGPLVTMDGAVVGIVTAIMNPTDQATFVGIGFAVPIENAAEGAGMPPF